MAEIIEKILSANDVGLTGSHQAGILIPKQDELLLFFPALDVTAVNPRVDITLTDCYGKEWTFKYIYYNNKYRGGTRNEYRLTGMTAYLRQNNAKVGDTLIFEKQEDDYSVRFRDNTEHTEDIDGTVMLVLNDSWKVIHY